MVGLPGDGWRAVSFTKRVLKRLSPEYVLVSVATPYPGTLFYRQAVEKGWLADDRLEHLDGFTPVVSYPGFTSQEIADAAESLRSWRRSEKRLSRAHDLLGGSTGIHPGEF
jgi:radical SAM superfamily enzyme YgiQ (UPF0313 family)